MIPYHFRDHLVFAQKIRDIWHRPQSIWIIWANLKISWSLKPGKFNQNKTYYAWSLICTKPYLSRIQSSEKKDFQLEFGFLLYTRKYTYISILINLGVHNSIEKILKMDEILLHLHLLIYSFPYDMLYDICIYYIVTLFT